MSLAKTLDADLFASSQVSGKIGALPCIVAASGTVGDLAAGTYSWWQSQVTASGSFAARGLADMRTLYNNILATASDMGAPDFCVTTQTIMEYYEGILEPQKRYTDDKMASAGFANLKYKNLPLTFDSNVASGEMYMLKSDNIWLIVHSDANFSTLPFVRPANQDARTSQIIAQLEVVTDNKRKLGKITGISA